MPRSSSSTKLNVLNVLQFPRAVADALGRNTHAFEHREIQVRHRRLAIVTNMAAGPQPAAATPREQDRQVVMVVAIAVADGAAVHDHAIVEQRSFAFGSS